MWRGAAGGVKGMIRWKKESMKAEKARGERPRQRGEGGKRAEFRNVRRGGLHEGTGGGVTCGEKE